MSREQCRSLLASGYTFPADPVVRIIASFAQFMALIHKIK